MMRFIVRWVVPLLVAVFVLGVPERGFGDPNPAPVAGKRAKVKSRLKQIRAEMLRNRVGLDEATATRVEGVFEKYRTERSKQQQRLRSNRKALNELIKSDSNDQAAYTRALAEVRGADQELRRVRNAQADETAKFLTPKQQAKLAIALPQLQKRLKNALRHGGKAGSAP